MAVGSAVFTLNVNGPAAPATVSNTATVSSSSTDNTPGNNSSTANTNVIFTADLSITKTATQPGPYGTGNQLTYTIVVANGGPGSAANVVVTDILPAGTTFVSATPTQGSCSGTTTVTCSLGTLANTGSATISLTLTLPAAPGPVSNTASVAATSNDTNAGNNASTSAIAVVPASNIPATSPMVLLLLGIVLAMAGFVTQRLK